MLSKKNPKMWNLGRERDVESERDCFPDDEPGRQGPSTAYSFIEQRCERHLTNHWSSVCLQILSLFFLIDPSPRMLHWYTIQDICSESTPPVCRVWRALLFTIYRAFSPLPQQGGGILGALTDLLKYVVCRKVEFLSIPFEKKLSV